MDFTASQSATPDLTGGWKALRLIMKTAEKILRTALWWLRPRNPQITTYFGTRIVDAKKGRPSEALLQATRKRRQKNAHAS